LGKRKDGSIGLAGGDLDRKTVVLRLSCLCRELVKRAEIRDGLVWKDTILIGTYNLDINDGSNTNIIIIMIK